MASKHKNIFAKAAGILLAAHMQIAAAARMVGGPRIPLPSHLRSIPKRTRDRLRRKAARTIIQHGHRKRNVLKRTSWRQKMKPIPKHAQQVIIESMTGWQRIKWQRAGADRDLVVLQKFADMPHWKSARA